MRVNPETEALRQAAQQQAESFRLPQDWREGRAQVPGLTIDSGRTKDRDDAIWLESSETGYQARVSISDVGSFLGQGPATEYALLLGETRYLATSNIPMFPRVISERKLSLLDTQETPVVSVVAAFDKIGEVTNISLNQDRIRPRRLSYEGVSLILSGRGEPHEVEALEQYERFAVNLLERRRAKGAFAFYDMSEGLATDEEGALVQLRAGQAAGQIIVQEFMVLANAAIAEYMLGHHIPSIYRNHRLMIDVTPEQVRTMLTSGSREQLEILKRGFGRARYSTDADGHDALHLPVYMHWTSPLRRFADFANHQNLAAHLKGEELPYTTEQLDAIASHLNSVQDKMRQRFHDPEDAERARTMIFLGKTAEKLVSLEGDNFSKVVRMAAETGIVPQEFTRALQTKAESGTIKTNDAARLIFAPHAALEQWSGVDEAILTHLQQRPYDAISILSAANQAQLIKPPVIESSSEGSGFHCKITIERIDGTVVASSALGSSKKAAQQVAAVNVVADVLGRPVADELPGLIPPVEIGALLEEAALQTPSFNNPKGALQETFQRRGYPLPQYATEQAHTDGTNFVFRSIVSITTPQGELRTFSGLGPTKKAAEAAAASYALGEMQTSESKPEVNNQLDSSANPISALNERQQAAGLPAPQFAFIKSGPDNAPSFTCTVSVATATGEASTYQASGPNKQLAKTAAARKAIQN